MSGAPIIQQTEKQRLIRFGVFEMDLRTGELRKAGVRIKLQGQPFKILTMLVENPGQLVTHEDIRRRLWGWRSPWTLSTVYRERSTRYARPWATRRTIRGLSKPFNVAAIVLSGKSTRLPRTAMTPSTNRLQYRLPSPPHVPTSGSSA